MRIPDALMLSYQIVIFHFTYILIKLPTYNRHFESDDRQLITFG